MKPETSGPSPVPVNAAAENKVMAVLRSFAWYMSLRTPPTIVENVELMQPVKNRQTHMPAKVGVTAETTWKTTHSTPVTMKTGRRPLISLNGARNIGAMPKPHVKRVTPMRATTSEICHSAVI